MHNANLKKNNETIDNTSDISCRIAKYKNKMTVSLQTMNNCLTSILILNLKHSVTQY